MTKIENSMYFLVIEILRFKHKILTTLCNTILIKKTSPITETPNYFSFMQFCGGTNFHFIIPVLQFLHLFSPSIRVIASREIQQIFWLLTILHNFLGQISGIGMADIDLPIAPIFHCDFFSEPREQNTCSWLLYKSNRMCMWL